MRSRTPAAGSDFDPYRRGPACLVIGRRARRMAKKGRRLPSSPPSLAMPVHPLVVRAHSIPTEATHGLGGALTRTSTRSIPTRLADRPHPIRVSPRKGRAMASGTIERKCVKGHNKAEGRCSPRCVRWYRASNAPLPMARAGAGSTTWAALPHQGRGPISTRPGPPAPRPSKRAEHGGRWVGSADAR
jgi:hypothetical protein